MSINSRWYAVPAYSPSGEAKSTDWQVYDEAGAAIINSGDRDAVEHIVKLQNESISGRHHHESAL